MIVTAYSGSFLIILLLLLIFGSGIEFGFACLLGLVFFWFSSFGEHGIHTYFILFSLFAPIPIASYLLGSLLNELVPKQSRRIISALFLSISLAAIMHSGYFEETIGTLTEMGIEYSQISLAGIMIASFSAVFFCAFLVAGVLLLIVAIFELSLRSMASITRIQNPIPISSLRVYLAIGVFCAASNLVLTLAVNNLHPFSILKLVGV